MSVNDKRSQICGISFLPLSDAEVINVPGSDKLQVHGTWDNSWLFIRRMDGNPGTGWKTYRAGVESYSDRYLFDHGEPASYIVFR